jgi:hypothetical protein
VRADLYTWDKNNATNRKGEHSQRAYVITAPNCIYTTPMPLQNESKHNGNLIKNNSPQAKILKF